MSSGHDNGRSWVHIILWGETLLLKGEGNAVGWMSAACLPIVCGAAFGRRALMVVARSLMNRAVGADICFLPLRFLNH